MLLRASELVLNRHRGAKGDLLRMAGFLPHHNVDAYLKCDMLDCFGKYEREITETMDFPFRSPGNVMRTIYQLEAAACGRARYRLARRGVWGGKWRWLLNPFKHGRPYADSLQFVREKWRLGAEKIRKWHAGLFCFNDTDGITDDDRAWVRGVYERMFPEKSQFERGVEDVAARSHRGKVFPVMLPRLASSLFRLFPIRRRRVLLQTFQGEYCCNPKYVTEALAGCDGVELVWALSGEADAGEVPAGVKIVRKNSLRHCLAAATAKVWLENGLNLVRSPYIRKRRGQVYFQPLHGSLGLKRQGLAGADVRAKADSITDYCISNSAFEDEVYRTSYWPTTEILRYGHPRNDVFFKSTDDKARITRRVRKALGVPENARLALYAPTFRSDGDVSCLDLDPVMLRSALERRFGGDWMVLFRLHKRDAARHGAPPGSWVDASGIPDMQELMVACDVGITDYSSWICDYVLGDGYGFIYATDVEKYAENPGFYYPLETTPFPVARSNGELAAAIAGFDPVKYLQAKKEFIKSKGCVDDGHASQRCAGKILEVLE